jgi:hypothetical protein
MMMQTTSPSQKSQLPVAIRIILPEYEISCAFNRRSENIVIEAVIISKLKFCDVQWHILGTHLLKRADDTALEDAPKDLNRLGVYRVDNMPLATSPRPCAALYSSASLRFGPQSRFSLTVFTP